MKPAGRPSLRNTMLLEAMIEQLAKRIGVCPVHGTPLWCICAFTWTGTDAEWTETQEYLDALEPYWGCPQPSGQHCPKCQGELWCDRCYADQGQSINVPREVMDDADFARYAALGALLMEKGPVSKR